MAINTLVLTEAGRLISKIDGRRNYVIRWETKDNIAYAGGMGVMRCRGLMGEYIAYMSNHGTTWAEFTYKKDFKAALKALEEKQIEIYYL